MRQMKRWMPALALMLAVVTFAYAKEREELGPYRLLTTISIPGFGNGFDISWADSSASRYYLADRGNATAIPPVAARIDVIDTRRLTLLAPLPVHAAGNGVVAIRTRHDSMPKPRMPLSKRVYTAKLRHLSSSNQMVAKRKSMQLFPRFVSRLLS